MPNPIDSAGDPTRSMLVDVFQYQRSAHRTGRAPVVQAPGRPGGAESGRDGAARRPDGYDARGRRVPHDRAATAVPEPLQTPTLADPMAPHTMWERLRIQREQLLKPFTR